MAATDEPMLQLPRHLTSYRPRQPDAPTIVGLYGLPGSGKSHMLDQVKTLLPDSNFAFYDGSEILEKLVPGGLDTFRALHSDQQWHYRETAIDHVRKQCMEQGQVGVVAGHFMFWSEDAAAGSSVCTTKDLSTYTHIIYLDVPAAVVAQRRAEDKTRERAAESIHHLQQWQSTEKNQLRQLCYDHSILFSLLAPGPTALSRLVTMLLDFRQHSEESNMESAEKRLDQAVMAERGQLQTMLVLDADRTLAPQDTGTIFWEELAHLGVLLSDTNPLKTLFSGPLGYSYTAFRQATLLYEDAVDESAFEVLCAELASKVTVYPEFEYLLKKVAGSEHAGAVIITCGLRNVWSKVLARLGIPETVKVIGGGRIADGMVVTENVKGALVQRLRKEHDIYVWAFGDSPLDLKMLTEADQGIVVVGDERSRSSTMTSCLRNAIDTSGLRVRQVLIPRDTSPRLDLSTVPIVEIMDVEFLQSMFRVRQNRRTKLDLIHATDKNAASVLMTPMRDASVSGPALRKAHRQVGRYLAMEYLTKILGVEQYSIRHVQGHLTSGFQLYDESETLIVALMRGGEPMAFGVNDVFPRAMFLHAKHANDIKQYHLGGRKTVIVVDSVVNSGKTVVEFIDHIRSLQDTARIVIVAGVVQAESVGVNGPLQSITTSKNVTIVALRLSENKFTGQGGTDTGNRLFNTTKLQ